MDYAEKYSTSYTKRFCRFFHSADMPMYLVKEKRLKYGFYKSGEKLLIWFCNTGSEIKFKYRE